MLVTVTVGLSAAAATYQLPPQTRRSSPAQRRGGGPHRRGGTCQSFGDQRLQQAGVPETERNLDAPGPAATLHTGLQAPWTGDPMPAVRSRGTADGAGPRRAWPERASQETWTSKSILRLE